VPLEGWPTEEWTNDKERRQSSRHQEIGPGQADPLGAIPCSPGR